MIGPWRVTSAGLPALRESGGRVVNVASGLAHVAFPFAPAYCMSKRGLTAYSDALRFEHGDALTVTTVYPGFIRTPIHETSNAVGLALEGAIPAERVEDAARTLVRAALGRPARDLATTRAGTIQYWLARRSPRRLVDRVITGRLRQLVKGGHFDRSELAREFASRARPRRRLST
jgi:NAD(P)-dependent dehydrogenase (short-subunit alcohol dehydrogenase family)